MTDKSNESISFDLELLMYASRSTADPSQIEAIVATAQRKNAVHGLTGVLLFSGGHFLQVLEGESGSIRATQAAIEADPRHASVTVLLRMPAAQRRFAQWNMTLLGLDGADTLIQTLLAAPKLDHDRALRLLTRIEALAAESLPLSGRA